MSRPKSKRTAQYQKRYIDQTINNLERAQESMAKLGEMYKGKHDDQYRFCAQIIVSFDSLSKVIIQFYNEGM